MKFLIENKFDLTQLTDQQHKFLNNRFYDDYLRSIGKDMKSEEKINVMMDYVFNCHLNENDNLEFREFIYSLRNNDKLFGLYTFLYNVYSVPTENFKVEDVLMEYNQIMSINN